MGHAACVPNWNEPGHHAAMGTSLARAFSVRNILPMRLCPAFLASLESLLKVLVLVTIDNLGHLCTSAYSLIQPVQSDKVEGLGVREKNVFSTLMMTRTPHIEGTLRRGLSLA